MADKTKIEWAESTWNPVTGCTKVSPGCANCYIERTPPFRMEGRWFVKGAIPVRLHPDRLDVPLRWRKPRRVFVCSLADLFHEDVPDAFIDQVFATMALAPQHTFQCLTKRPERMRAYLTGKELPVYFHDGSLSPRPADRPTKVLWAAQQMCDDGAPYKEYLIGDDMDWPLPNVWLGVSVENQRMADERIPVLLDTPAAVRFLSCEPLLGPLDLRPWLERRVLHSPDLGGVGTNSYAPRIDWVIVGGESGPGSAKRKLVERCHCRTDGRWSCTGYREPRFWACEDCHGTGWRPKPKELEWVRGIRDQCVAAGTAFHLKQLGGPRPTSGGRLLDGREWNEMPGEKAKR